MEPTPEIFFTREWHHRTWRTWVACLGCGVVGGFALYGLVSLIMQGNLTREPLWKIIAGFTLFATVGGGMILISVVFAWRLISNPRERSTIDTNGVTVGRHNWTWEQMRFIRPERYAMNQIIIKIALKGKLDTMFWIGRPLTMTEYDEIMVRLMPFLMNNYPDLIE
jgi:hypothetical protein